VKPEENIKSHGLVIRGRMMEGEDIEVYRGDAVRKKKNG